MGTSLKQTCDTIFATARLHDDGVPTASIAVLNNGRTDAHVLTSGQETPETAYQAGSISKPICALTVAKLVDEGTLSYSTKVIDHLDPTIVDALTGGDAQCKALLAHVTIAHLLSHTSGLSQHGFPGYSGSSPIATPTEVLAGKAPANTPRVRFTSFPGAECAYSGGGYTVLQLALEHITGLPFATLMHQTVLEPLHMTRSWYGDLPASETDYVKAYSTAETVSEPARGFHVLPELAAAGLWSTPTDLLKAVAAIQDSLYSSTGFLTRETAEAMLAQRTDSAALGRGGLGWWINDVGFGHNGYNDPGYGSALAGFFDEDGGERRRNGIAIMTNSVAGYAACLKQIMAGIMYAQGWQGSGREGDVWMPSNRDKFVPYPAPSSMFIDADWKAWQGKWQDGWEIVEDAGGPALKFGDFAPMPLRPAAAPARAFENGRKEIWLVADALRVGVKLTWDDNGKGDEVVKLQTGDEKLLRRAL